MTDQVRTILTAFIATERKLAANAPARLQRLRHVVRADVLNELLLLLAPKTPRKPRVKSKGKKSCTSSGEVLGAL